MASTAAFWSRNALSFWWKNVTPADAGTFPVVDTSTELIATLEQN